MSRRSEREEKLLEELIALIKEIRDTAGIKKIQDAITAVVSGSENLPLKQEPSTGELHVKTV